MPENKERKVIKYGETPEPSETHEEPEEREVQKEPAEHRGAAENEAASAPDVPVPDYFKEQPETEQPERISHEELSGRIEERRSSIRTKQIRKKRLTILLMVVVFALLATMCGKDIVRLKAENVALKRQQVALKKERDELKAELESTSEQEYIRDQARKQLRLLNPGELLFVWDE